MKTFISILALALCCLFFHENSYAQNDAGYAIVEYMKVKPGMSAQYLECEKAWKLIHQERLKADYITGWQLEEVLYPSGANAEYDYLTLTLVKNWKAINDLNDTWTDEIWASLTKNLTAEQQEVVAETTC